MGILAFLLLFLLGLPGAACNYKGIPSLKAHFVFQVQIVPGFYVDLSAFVPANYGFCCSAFLFENAVPLCFFSEGPLMTAEFIMVNKSALHRTCHMVQTDKTLYPPGSHDSTCLQTIHYILPHRWKLCVFQPHRM